MKQGPEFKKEKREKKHIILFIFSPKWERRREDNSFKAKWCPPFFSFPRVWLIGSLPPITLSITEHSFKKGWMTSETEYSLSHLPWWCPFLRWSAALCWLFSLLFCVLFLAFAKFQKDSHTHLLPDNNFRHRFRGCGKDEFSFLPLNFGGAFKQNLMKEGRELNLF